MLIYNSQNHLVVKAFYVNTRTWTLYKYPLFYSVPIASVKPQNYVSYLYMFKIAIHGYIDTYNTA